MTREWIFRYRNVVLIVLVVLFLLLYTFTSQNMILARFVSNLGLKSIVTDDVAMKHTIFFLETSRYISPFGEIKLNPRQACAIESAAKNHPNRMVLLLYLVPDGYQSPIYFNPSDNSQLQLLKYDNIKIRRIELDRYLRNTPMDSWHGLTSSKFPVEHTSDTLRLLTLWKYGGIYFDLDFVITRNIDEIGTDFVVAETDDSMSNAALSFKKDGIGHKFLESCLTEIHENFRGDTWSYNGPQLILRVLEQYCTTPSIKEMSRDACQGINVLKPITFYPIPWPAWEDYFNPNKTLNVIRASKASFGIHLWNKMSHGTILDGSVDVAYSAIAEQHCPNVYHVNRNHF